MKETKEEPHNEYIGMSLLLIGASFFIIHLASLLEKTFKRRVCYGFAIFYIFLAILYWYIEWADRKQSVGINKQKGGKSEKERTRC